MLNWMNPTADVAELEKRIADMKAVHFWLDQNTKMLGSTIQALEVQRMAQVALAQLQNPTATNAPNAATAGDHANSPANAAWQMLNQQFQSMLGAVAQSQQPAAAPSASTATHAKKPTPKTTAAKQPRNKKAV